MSAMVMLSVGCENLAQEEEMIMSAPTWNVTPSAARLTESLRDIGYNFVSAVADLIDNSIAAGASEIDVVVDFAGEYSRVYVADDGVGMTANEVTEALRFGSRRDYQRGDLGRYGLGLKTASLSQCRVLTVVSAQQGRKVVVRTLDIDIIREFDDWLIIEPAENVATERARKMLHGEAGTVVILESLDRILPEKNASGGWARRRFETLVEKTSEHLSMVFHRFLSEENSAPGIAIVINGVKLNPWDPFARSESKTQTLANESFDVQVGDLSGVVQMGRYILPARNQFSSPAGFDAASGPLKWNRQQGLYIYRANRLVQWGGWAGIRSIDEHTKLARVSIDFDTDLDDAFNINVAKMRVALPGQLRKMLERPISELCILADSAYRENSPRSQNKRKSETAPAVGGSAEVGLALKSAAMQAGKYDELKSIVEVLRASMPEVADLLGF